MNTHSQTVITYQAPNGQTVELCTYCVRRNEAAGTWPRNRNGEEFCTVSHGAHRGRCSEADMDLSQAEESAEHVTYQIKINRNDGCGWVLDGCWGSEDAVCATVEEAEKTCRHLSEQYPDANWGYEDEDGDMVTVCEAACVADFDPFEVISSERMDSAAVGPVESLVVTEEGELTDGNASEPADLSSEDAFRAQVIAWREECGL